MRPLRRSHYAVRVEMTPLIDVIFLLLTFFIYSLVMTVEARILPVQLTTIHAAENTSPDQPQTGSRPINHAITLTRAGQYYYNQQPVDHAQLVERLAAFPTLSPRPRLFIAVEAQGDVDRGPMLVKLLEMLHQADIHDFAIVGQPAESPTPSEPTPSP